MDKTAWTVAVGNMPAPGAVKRSVMRSADKALRYIMNLEGFICFYPHYPDGTLCLFENENSAKRARNLMEHKGIRTGVNICECKYDPEDIKRGGGDEP